MKLSFFVATVSASHYRGGTYKVEQTDGTTLKISNTQTWALGSDNYSGGCEQSDVDNQIESDSGMSGACFTGTCDGAMLKYTALFVGSDYCYGDGSVLMNKPAGPFSFGWTSCCWVSLTDDNGNGYSSGGSDMQMVMYINDLDNNTPSFKLPPLWLIMAGCGEQIMNLAPTDPDGDEVKCRWATQEESGGAFNDGVNLPSLILDEENCIVTYDGVIDNTVTGVKPVGLMIEDFDADGNVKSSIPVQFLAQVWTPQASSNAVGSDNWPQWFPAHAHEGDHEHEVSKSRNRRSRKQSKNAEPWYCDAIPSFTADTPENNAIIDGKSGSVTFTLQAESDNGDISAFSYQAPPGLSCTAVDADGSITCSWTLTEEQLIVPSWQFCYDATDEVGLMTERRCLYIEAGVLPIKNIREMAEAVLDGSGLEGFTADDGVDYGCAGRGDYDYLSPTVGAHVDLNDHAFHVWKKCVQCAIGQTTPAPEYSYDKDNDDCANSSEESRAVCECDRVLVNHLYDSKAEYTNYKTKNCVKGSGGSGTSSSGGAQCCQWDQYYFASYNTNTHCCDTDGVKEIGTC